MNASKFSFFMMIFAGIGFMVGTGILITDDPLRSLCQRGCWLNYSLYAIFGEQGGKAALAVIWYLAAALCLALTLKLKIKGKRKARSPKR